MKRYQHLIATALFTVFLALTLTTSVAHAQEMPSKMYAVTDYMDAHDVQDYMEIEAEWKKLHQTLVNDGHMFWWGLYGVVSPAGSARPYNYVTVRLYTDFATIENPFPDEYFTSTFKDYSEDQLNALMDKTGASRSIVNSEYYVLENSLAVNNTEAPKYIHLGFMKVPQGGSGFYLNVEDETWKPLHQQRLEHGHIKDWQLWGRLFSGTNDEYNYVTVTGYDEWSGYVDSSINMEMAKKAHPDASDEELNKRMQDTQSSRDLVRSHAWILLDSTAPPSQ